MLEALLTSAEAMGQKPTDIDKGRQLFVDDALVAFSTLNRSFHEATVSANSPVMSPETPLELNGGVMPATALFSDGLWYDPQAGCFKMWYLAGYDDGFAYAESEDGISWRRPQLDIVPGTNRILPLFDGFRRNGSTVWLDHDAADQAERYKMYVYMRRTNGGWPRAEPFPRPEEPYQGHIYTSGDGKNWQFRGQTGPCGDNSGMYYTPFLGKWVFSVRTYDSSLGRTRSYVASEDFVAGRNWSQQDIRPLAASDGLDRADPELQYRPELYKLDCVAYESRMIGLFGIYYGPPNDIAYSQRIPKTLDLFLGTSRDGLTWERLNRTPFLSCSRQPGTWNFGYLHAAGGLCVIVGDELRFYFTGFSGASPAQGGGPYADARIGYATLRRDGFASMDGPGRLIAHSGSTSPRPNESPAVPLIASMRRGAGLLLTKPVTFSGGTMFVNAEIAPGSSLRTAVLNPDGSAIAGLSLEDCAPVVGNSTRHAVRWAGAGIAGAADRPVRLLFELDAGRLYSFWVSQYPSGASQGFVAAGGPAFTGATDTTGG